MESKQKIDQRSQRKKSHEIKQDIEVLVETGNKK